MTNCEKLKLFNQTKETIEALDDVLYERVADILQIDRKTVEEVTDCLYKLIRDKNRISEYQKEIELVKQEVKENFEKLPF